MSQSAELVWRLRQEARRKEYLKRIRENTSRYHRRYTALLNDLEQQGLDKFIPAEHQKAWLKLQDIQGLIDSDPESARHLSFQTGSEISNLPGIARAARKEFTQKKRIQYEELKRLNEEASSEFCEFVLTNLNSIDDPIVRDFTFNAIRSLQSKYMNKSVSQNELNSIKKEFSDQFLKIRSNAQSQADEWKKRKSEENKREAQNLLVDIHSEEATKDVEQNPEALATIISRFDILRSKLKDQSKLSDEEVGLSVRNNLETVDNIIVDENCRKSTVRALIDVLRKSGFATEKPKLIRGEKNEVVILARKPSGSKASFQIGADGGFAYKFDQYEGMKCKDDIDQVLPLLQQAYSIDLSDERIIWQNPDRISKSEKPISRDGKESRHGI